MISLILAGKVGSRIASEIGTMRVTEQIDALEIMGVNSANYLILPKIAACVILNPFLIAISMFLGLLGGWFIAIFTGIVTSHILLKEYSHFLFHLKFSMRLLKQLFLHLLLHQLLATRVILPMGERLKLGVLAQKLLFIAAFL